VTGGVAVLTGYSSSRTRTQTEGKGEAVSVSGRREGRKGVPPEPPVVRMDEHQSPWPERRDDDPECGSTAHTGSTKTALEGENMDQPRHQRVGASPERSTLRVLTQLFSRHIGECPQSQSRRRLQTIRDLRDGVNLPRGHPSRVEDSRHHGNPGFPNDPVASCFSDVVRRV
jgi:hypothetical protein